MGGTICSGFPGGLEIAQNLCAKAWISAHDADKDSSGFANAKIKIEKFPREEVEAVVSPRSDKFQDRRVGTEAVILMSGEEITLSGALASGRDDIGVEKFEIMERSDASTLVELASQSDSVDAAAAKLTSKPSMDSGIAS